MDEIREDHLIALCASSIYIPCENELSCIKSLISRDVQLLIRLEDELNGPIGIGNLDEELEKERQYAMLFTRIGTLRKCAAPVRRLPNDVLQEIFLACLPFSDNSPLSFVRRAPILLTHVCRRWRDLAMSTGRLWSYISVPLRAHKISWTERIAAFHEWLIRSQSCPLNISFTGHLYSNFNPSIRDTIQATLLSHSSRWDAIDLTVDRPYFDDRKDDLAHRFRHLLAATVPLIRSLRFELYDYTLDLWRRSTLLSASTLKSVSITTTNLSASLKTSLLPLSSPVWCHITHLSVTCNYLKRPPFSFFRTLGQLTALVALQLKISHCISGSPTNASNSIASDSICHIHLPSLRQLHVDSECPQLCQNLFRHLVAPTLVSLWYGADNCGHCQSDREESEGNLCTMLKASNLLYNASVRRLTLDPVQWPNDALYRMLERLPGVESLVLETLSYFSRNANSKARFSRVRFEPTVVDDSFLRRLCGINDSSTSLPVVPVPNPAQALLPHLTRLSLFTCTSYREEAFQEFLKIRGQSSAQHHGTQNIGPTRHLSRLTHLGIEETIVGYRYLSAERVMEILAPYEEQGLEVYMRKSSYTEMAPWKLEEEW